MLEKYRIPGGALFVNRVIPAEADGDFLQRRKAREAEYLATIDNNFARHIRYRVPLLETDVVGLTGLSEVATHLPEIG